MPKPSLAQSTAPIPDVGQALDALRHANPLVQCLTNIVVANFTANVLLASGASPAMVDNATEAGGFAQIAGGVLVNTGTPYPETSQAMVNAAAGASTAGTPWVLDPVAAGMPWRTGIARDALKAGHPAIIRGNASEIMALAGLDTTGRGPETADEVEAALPAARQLAEQNHCAVAVSGPVDHITDGTCLVTVTNGHPWMTKVTGVGCSLGGLMAAYAAAVPDPVDAAVAATAHLCVAAEHAAADTKAPGSFAVSLIDYLYLITPEQLADEAVIGCDKA